MDSGQSSNHVQISIESQASANTEVSFPPEDEQGVDLHDNDLLTRWDLSSVLKHKSLIYPLTPCMQSLANLNQPLALKKPPKSLSGPPYSFNADSTLIAEALVLREAATIVDNLRIPDAIFESDCLSLIDACNGKNQMGEIRNIVEDVKTLLIRIENSECVWIPREANEAANMIARLNIDQSLPMQWKHHPPDNLRKILVKDKRLAQEEQNRVFYQQREYVHP